VRSTLDDQSPAKSQMQQLLRYVEKQWLNKSTVGPSRTSIAVESFHASLRRHIKIVHPNLFAFLGHLQQYNLQQSGGHHQSYGWLAHQMSKEMCLCDKWQTYQDVLAEIRQRKVHTTTVSTCGQSRRRHRHDDNWQPSSHGWRRRHRGWGWQKRAANSC